MNSAYAVFVLFIFSAVYVTVTYQQLKNR